MNAKTGAGISREIQRLEREREKAIADFNATWGLCEHRKRTPREETEQGIIAALNGMAKVEERVAFIYRLAGITDPERPEGKERMAAFIHRLPDPILHAIRFDSPGASEPLNINAAISGRDAGKPADPAASAALPFFRPLKQNSPG